MQHMQNYSLAVFLMSDAARGILASYEPSEKGAPDTTFFKTLDPSLKVGDYVVVETNTRHHMTVVRIEEVDVEPDWNSSAKVRWILSRALDIAAFEEIKGMEAKAISAIKKAETRKAREELRKAMLGDVAEEDLPALPSYTVEPERPAEPPVHDEETEF